MASIATAEIASATSGSLVFPDLAGTNGTSVLAELAEGLASRLDGIEPETVRSGFVEREQLSSTALGAGLAIPHCKLSRLDRIRVAVGVHRNGVQFGAPDGAPTRLFLAVVSPASAPGSHLRLLASIARWARTPGRIDAVVEAGDAETILRLLTSDEDGRSR